MKSDSGAHHSEAGLHHEHEDTANPQKHDVYSRSEFSNRTHVLGELPGTWLLEERRLKAGAGFSGRVGVLQYQINLQLCFEIYAFS